MNRSRPLRWAVSAIGIMLMSSCIFVRAQEKGEYQPKVGQAGKDVVWVPTQQDLVDRMLEMAKVTSRDYVIDLGSGDGRTVITAAKLGAQALGIEYNPDMVELSKRNAVDAGVTSNASFIKADLFESDLSKATVITMFLLPDINLRLRPRLLNLKPGTRVVSNSFTMEDWEADGTVNLEHGCINWCTAYLWIIPAKVEGKWQFANGSLDITQMFQNISGKLEISGQTDTIIGKMSANAISFRAGSVEYEGKVEGDSIVLQSKSQGKIRATREK
jgi:precorrin-6B methylase 2